MTSTEESIHPSVSQDGTVAFAGLNSRTNLWLVNLAGGAKVESTRLTTDIEIDSAPSISRDGQRILYFRRLGNERQMILRRTDGPEIPPCAAKSHPDECKDKVPAGTRGMVAPSGDFIVYTKPNGTTRDIFQKRGPQWVEALVQRDGGELLDIAENTGTLLMADQSGVVLRNLNQGSAITILRNGPLVFDQASVSPDGRAIAYLGVRDAEHSQLFVAPFNRTAIDPTSSMAVTSAESWHDKPRWTAKGDALVYLSDRDGFPCIWKQEIGAGLKTLGPPTPVVHFHNVQVSPQHLSRLAFNLSVATDTVLYNAADVHANIWLAKR
jgi:Tol biopolymer transport system component